MTISDPVAVSRYHVITRRGPSLTPIGVGCASATHVRREIVPVELGLRGDGMRVAGGWKCSSRISEHLVAADIAGKAGPLESAPLMREADPPLLCLRSLWRHEPDVSGSRLI